MKVGSLTHRQGGGEQLVPQNVKKVAPEKRLDRPLWEGRKQITPRRTLTHENREFEFQIVLGGTIPGKKGDRWKSWELSCAFSRVQGIDRGEVSLGNFVGGSGGPGDCVTEMTSRNWRGGGSTGGGGQKNGVRKKGCLLFWVASLL